MDMMTSELNQNLESEEGPFLAKGTWVYDMTVPLQPVKSDQLCFEPESFFDQLKKSSLSCADVLIVNFEKKYPNVFKVYQDEQKRQLLEFIKIYTENHEGVK